MSGHTPGPWCLYEDDATVEISKVDGQIESPFGACTADGVGIAATWCGHTADQTVTVDEAEANARLIAAAPDLWAKAYSADTCLSMAFSYARELGRHDEARHINEVQRALRDAIAKAEGRISPSKEKA